MSKMTMSSKEQKIFSNKIWPIVSGLHLFLENVGDKLDDKDFLGGQSKLRIGVFFFISVADS